VRPPIDGSVTLVTGASSGIGEALARALAPRVGTLVLVARRAERLERLAAELADGGGKPRVAVAACDLGDRRATDDMLSRVRSEHGAVDVLVNNAGFGDFGCFDHSDWDKVARMIELNVVAVTHLTHRVAPAMVAKGRGGILMISSGFGLTVLPGFAAYAATKHFVSGLSEALRMELAPAGVVVTQVCPGPVATEFEQHVGNFTGRRPQRIVEISAERCARAALAAFERGRALVVPGTAMKLLMLLAALSPRGVMRVACGPAASWLRREQERARAALREPAG
jgi:short-subunit dehydrogenase